MTILSQAETIRDEILPRANTATRVGTCLVDIANALPVAYSGTWALKPAANTIDADQIVFINDFPLAGAIGSWWKSVPIINVYAPFSGDLLLSGNGGKVATDGSATDHNMQSVIIPEGVLLEGVRIEISCAFSKDSGAIAGTYRVRIGTANTSADATVHQVAVLAATRSDKIQSEIFFVSTTSVSVTPTANGGALESTTVWPADVTIPDVTSNDNYISVWFEPAGLAVMELVYCRITLYFL